MSFTSTSTWPWVDHPDSGLQQATKRPLQTRIPCGSASYMLTLAAYLNSPVRSTKSTPSDINVLRLLVSARIQVLFHSPPGVLFTIHSQYYALSVAREYLALEGGPPRFKKESTCPVLLTDLSRLPQPFAYAAVTLFGGTFQTLLLDCKHTCELPEQLPLSRRTPLQVRFRAFTLHGLGLFPVRSPLLSESRLISFPRGS